MHPGRAAISGQFAHCRAVALGLGYPGRELIDDMAQTMRLLLLGNLARDAVGIQHVLVPIEHFRHRGRLGPGWIPHVDRKDQRVSARNIVEYCLGLGVFERIPPSQYNSPSMRTAGNAGGNAPDAMMCSTPSLQSRLSKYRISLVRKWAAPTVRRGLQLFTRSKSMSSPSVRLSGSVE